MRNTNLTVHADRLYGYAISLSRNPTEAEDLVQETYVRALPAIGRLRTDSSVRGWLFAILRNIWYNQLRHRRCSPEFVEIDAKDATADKVSDKGRNCLELCIAKMEFEGVRKAIQELPLEYREIILLREYEELSYQEIATVLNCPPGTVMSRLARARGKLRIAMTSRPRSPRGIFRHGV